MRFLDFNGLGDLVDGRALVGEFGEESRKLDSVLAWGCSSWSSGPLTTFRRRRFAGGAINATVASQSVALRINDNQVEFAAFLGLIHKRWVFEVRICQVKFGACLRSSTANRTKVRR